MGIFEGESGVGNWGMKKEFDSSWLKEVLEIAGRGTKKTSATFSNEILIAKSSCFLYSTWKVKRRRL